MKRKYVAIILGILLSISGMEGCASEQPAEETQTETAEGDSEDKEAVFVYDMNAEDSSEEVNSQGRDENGILVCQGAVAALRDFTVTRNSMDSTGGGAAGRRGKGAAVLVSDGTLYMEGSAIDTDAAGGAGIFAYDKGITYAADTAVSTQQNESGGINVSEGGRLYGWDLDVETFGEDSPAIGSIGGGIVTVEGGRYTSDGENSPAVFARADIALKQAEVTAERSEAARVEGGGSLRLFDSSVLGGGSDGGQNDFTWNVLLCRGDSKDAPEGKGTFEMNGGYLRTQSGGMFYVTNTEADITLSGVGISTAGDNEFLLRCTGNGGREGWGEKGENGARCVFTAGQQVMKGDVIWDSISTLDCYLTDESSWTGALIDDETWAGSGGSGYCSLSIDESSTWIVTGDSRVSSLYNSGSIVDEEGNPVSIVGTDGTAYINGTGRYTVTVDQYGENTDLSGRSQITQWSDCQVENPFVQG
ncbi:MAG: hypothetical protein ACOX8E_07195 [Ruminococcus sp.]